MKKYLIYIAVSFLFSGILSAQNFDRNAIPKAGPTPSINIAKPQIFKMSNGLTVLVVENHKLPRVNVALTIDRAPVKEGNIVGVGSVLSTQLGNGTTNISKDEFNKKIDYLGANLSFWMSGASANMLSKYFVDVMELMADAVTHPKFDDKEVKKAIDRKIEELKTEEKSAKTISRNIYNALIYGKNTALGEFITKESLEKIKTVDVENFYNNYYTPNSAYLAIVGDVKFKKVKKLVEKLFADWKAGKEVGQTEISLENQKNISETEINVVNLPSAVQSVINAGHITKVRKKDPLYFSANIANYILGGGTLESRLNQNLREKNAFTYGAYSLLSFYKYAPSFKVNTSVRNEVVPGAVSEIMVELENIQNITDEELVNAKAQMKGRFIRSMEQPGTIAQFSINTLIEDLPADFFNNYLKSVENVTKESVVHAVKEVILPSQTRILVVGNVEEMGDLEKIGFPVKYFDKNATPTTKPQKKTIASGITTKTIAEKYIKAIGGYDAVNKVKSITLDATAKVQGMEMNMVVKSAVGAKTSIETKMMGNTMQKIVFDGNKGFVEARGQKQSLPEEVKVKMAGEKNVFPELSFGENKNYELKGVETVNEQEAYHVKNGTKSYYYSVASGLKIAEVEVQKMGEKEVRIPINYSDYKEVEGVLLPFKITQSIMGQDIAFAVSSYVFNQVTDADFK